MSRGKFSIVTVNCEDEMKNRIDPSMMFFLFLILLSSCDLLEKEELIEEDEEISHVPKPGPTPLPIPLLPDNSLLNYECFVADESPQIMSGDFFKDSHWNDPAVLFVDNHFIMYASSPVERASDHVGIYRMISNDGINWQRFPEEPVLTYQSLWWASHGIETPSVIQFNGQYHMFFTAYNHKSPIHFKIGHAISEDGVYWEVRQDFILEPSRRINDFDGLIVAEPGAVVFQGQIYLYFSGVGYHDDIDDSDNFPGSIVQTIGLIKSKNGEDWTEPQMVMMPPQDLFPRYTAEGNEYYGLSTPQPTVITDKLYLFFDTVKEVPSWHQSELFYAYSIDGENEWQFSERPIFSYEDFSWTSSEIRAPQPLLVDKTLYLWFAGHYYVESDYFLSIGRAKCEL